MRLLLLVSNSVVRSVRFALLLPLLHLSILAAPLFREERQVWRYIPILQAWQDEEKAHPDFGSGGMPALPCYEYRFSNAARLIFIVNLPTALLIGSPQGCPQSLLALATGGLKPPTPVMSVRTGVILTATLIVLGICLQWWLIGRWLDRRRAQLKSVRVSILPTAVITLCGILMLPTIFFRGRSVAELVNIFSGMFALLAWLALLVAFTVAGTKWLIGKLRRNSASVSS